MLHNLVVVVEPADACTEFEEKAVGIVEVDGTAPFVIDYGSDVNTLLEQVCALSFKILDRIAIECEVIKGRGQVLGAVNISLEFLWYALNLLGTHKCNQGSVPSIHERMLNPAAAWGFQDIAPCDFPTKDTGVEIHRPIDIERCQTEVMHSLAFHQLFPPTQCLSRSLAFNFAGGNACGSNPIILFVHHCLGRNRLEKQAHRFKGESRPRKHLRIVVTKNPASVKRFP
jgi:hypothetical protein